MNSIKQDLPAPTVDGVEDGQLDPGSVPESGAMARITNVPVSWGGSTLTLYLQELQGAVLYQLDWPVGSHGRDINLPIPKADLVANYGKDVQVHYSVSGIGASLPLDIKLDQGFSGAVEFDLAQHGYVVAYTHSEARPPQVIPAFARMQRVLPGATGYSSSDEKVATVDSAGIVTARSNGQATISASSAGGPASYALTITGIEEFHVLSPAATWDGAQQLCTQTGLALPAAADFARLLNFYPLPVGHYLELPDYQVWGTYLGAGTANTFDLNSGAAESFDTSELLQAVGVKRGGGASG